eukprot:PhM_4_TR2293/c1_g1_i1/m.70101
MSRQCAQTLGRWIMTRRDRRLVFCRSSWSSSHSTWSLCTEWVHTLWRRSWVMGDEEEVDFTVQGRSNNGCHATDSDDDEDVVVSAIGLQYASGSIRERSDHVVGGRSVTIVSTASPLSWNPTSRKEHFPTLDCAGTC